MPRSSSSKPTPFQDGRRPVSDEARPWLRIPAFALAIAIPILVGIVFVFAFWQPARAAHSKALVDNRAAEVALRSGQESEAENHWLRALAEWPEDASAYRSLGDFYRDHNNPEVAAVCYRQLLRVAPHQSHVYCRLAVVAQQDGAEGDARSNAQRELTLDPNCPRAVLLLARMDRHGGNYGKAKTEAEKAYRQEPGSEEAVVTYAETMARDTPDQAVTMLLKAREALPKSWQVAFYLGWCQARLADTTAAVNVAIAELQRAEQLAPHAGRVHSELCRILLQQNRLSEAVNEGALAVRDSPTEPTSYFQYSQSLRRAGRTAEASEIVKKFTELQNAQSQQETLNRLYGARPGDPKIAHDLAAIDEKLGKIKDAVTVLELALSVDPRNSALQKQLNELAHRGAPL